MSISTPWAIVLIGKMTIDEYLDIMEKKEYKFVLDGRDVRPSLRNIQTAVNPANIPLFAVTGNDLGYSGRAVSAGEIFEGARALGLVFAPMEAVLAVAVQFYVNERVAFASPPVLTESDGHERYLHLDRVYGRGQIFAYGGYDRIPAPWSPGLPWVFTRAPLGA